MNRSLLLGLLVLTVLVDGINCHHEAYVGTERPRRGGCVSKSKSKSGKVGRMDDQVDITPTATKPASTTSRNGRDTTSKASSTESNARSSRDLGAAESPLSIAKRGGRHSGFLKQAQQWTPAQRARASRNLQKQIELHEAKLDNPAGFVKGWGNMSKQQQQGLVRHWEKELANFSEQQSILHAL